MENKVLHYFKYYLYETLCNLTFGSLHRKFHSKKMKYKNIKNMYENNNSIILHKISGEKIKVNKILGCQFLFRGNGAVIEIYEPYNFYNCKFLLGDNSKIIIGRTEKIIQNVLIDLSYSENCQIIIGKNNSFNGLVSYMLWAKDVNINIGDDCLFANDVKFKPADHHTIYDISNGKPLNYSKEINIGNHVWIAEEAMILKNVSIPSNSIIASRAVVTKSYTKENTIIAGVPAKVVKENINWDETNIRYYKQD